jgi:serine/threonine protein kinase
MDQKIGRYSLIRKLGHGGMGEVFLAADSQTKNATRVVIKRILPQNAANPDFKRMFLSEMELVARFRHDNIVALKDHGYEGEYYIVLEYVGPDLGEIIRHARDKGEPIPPALCAKMIAMACDGLHYIHQQRIVHYDISPENLAISRAGIVKVLDFGVSRAADDKAPTTGQTPRKKLAYMAPERVKGADRRADMASEHVEGTAQADWRVDIYALGVLLYELLSGCRPYESHAEVDEDKDPIAERERRQKLRRSILNDAPVRPLREILPDISRELERIVERALASKPEARYQSCHEMGVELERFVTSCRPAISPADLPELVERLYPHELNELPAQSSAGPTAKTVTESPPAAVQQESDNVPIQRGRSFAEMALSVTNSSQILPFAIGVFGDIARVHSYLIPTLLGLLASFGLLLVYLVFRFIVSPVSDSRQDVSTQNRSGSDVPTSAPNVVGAKASLNLSPIAGKALLVATQVVVPCALGAVSAAAAREAYEASKVVYGFAKTHIDMSALAEAEPPLPQYTPVLPPGPLVTVIPPSSVIVPPPPPVIEPPPPPAKVRFRLNEESRRVYFCGLKESSVQVKPGDLVPAGSRVECSYSCVDGLGNGTPRTDVLTIRTNRRQDLSCP